MILLLNLGNLVYFIRAKNEEFKRVMKENDRLLKDTEKRFDDNRAKLKQWGMVWTTVGAAVVGTMALLTSKNNEMNKEMANIGTLIPGNISRLKELKSEIQDLSVVVGKGTKDLTGGTYQLISAFGDNADTTEKLTINAKAATAGLAETTDAINLTSAVTKAYGDVSAEATKKAADLAFMTVKLGQTTFPELAKSIGRVVPLSSQLNITQEEMFTAYATLTGVTGGTAEVSTQIAAALRAFLTQTEDMKAAIKALGYESASQLLGEKGLVGALKAVISTTNGSDEAVAKLFGSAESLLSVFALAGSQADTFTQKLSQMKNATGTLDEAFKEQTEGINALGFQWNQFKQRIEVVLQQMGELASGGMEVLTNAAGVLASGLESVVQWFRALPEPVQKTLSVLIALSGALALVIGPIMMIVGYLPAIKAGLVIVGGALTGLTGPIGIVTVGIIALTTAIVGITAATEKAKAEHNKLLDDYRQGKTSVDDLADSYSKLTDKMREAKPDSEELSRLTKEHQDLMDDIARKYPHVVKAYDELGKAREIDLDLLQKQIDKENELLRTRLENAKRSEIESVKRELKDAQSKFTASQGALGDRQNEVTRSAWIKKEAKFRGVSLEEAAKTYDEITAQIAERVRIHNDRVVAAQKRLDELTDLGKPEVNPTKKPGPKTTYKCFRCGKEFSSQEELDEHMKKVHGGNGGEAADPGTTVFRESLKLYEHRVKIGQLNNDQQIQELENLWMIADTTDERWSIEEKMHQVRQRMNKDKLKATKEDEKAKGKLFDVEMLNFEHRVRMGELTIDQQIEELEKLKELAMAQEDQKRALRDLAAIEEQIFQLREQKWEQAKKFIVAEIEFDQARQEQMDEYKDAWSDMMNGLAKGTTSFADVWDDIMDRMRKKFFDTLYDMMMESQKSGAIRQILGIVFGAAGGSYSNVGWANTGAHTAPVGGGGYYHNGGIVRPLIAHTGMYIGNLKQDEVPIVAQTGEEVVSRNDRSQILEGIERLSRQGGGGDQYIFNINAIDPASFADIVRRNPDAIVGTVISDYKGNGATRKVLGGDRRG